MRNADCSVSFKLLQHRNDRVKFSLSESHIEWLSGDDSYDSPYGYEGWKEPRVVKITAKNGTASSVVNISTAKVDAKYSDIYDGFDLPEIIMNIIPLTVSLVGVK